MTMPQLPWTPGSVPWTTLDDQVRAAIYYHEDNSGGEASAKLSDASGKSGYSYGRTQSDTKTNKAARDGLIDLLRKKGLGQQDLDAIENGLKNSANDPAARAVYNQYHQQIADALASKDGQELIERMDAANAQKSTDAVRDALKLARDNFDDSGVLSDTNHTEDAAKAIAELSQWSNMTGGLSQFQDWLNGKPIDNVTPLTHAPTLQDIETYMSQQKYFREHPDQLTKFKNDAEHSAQNAMVPPPVPTPRPGQPGDQPPNPDPVPHPPSPSPGNNGRGGSHGTGNRYLDWLLKFFHDAIHDPLIIDVSKSGFNLTARADSATYFSWTGGDFAQNTGWIGSGTGFLARDANADGSIDRDELFGSNSQSGFSALAELDSNSDGIISAADTAFSSLKVWQDANLDGTAESGELKSLSELGIASIRLATSTSGANLNGNVVANTSIVTFSDGSHTQAGEVEFAYSTAYTTYTGAEIVSPEAAALPQLSGYGNVADLRHAMSADATLLEMVSALATMTPADGAAYDTALQNVIYRWAGVSDVIPGSRGSIFDAQKLGVLEALAGSPFASANGNNPWYPGMGPTLTKAWENFVQGVKARMMIQNEAFGLSAFFDVDPSNDAITLRPYADIFETVAWVAAAAPTGETQATAYWINALTIINSYVGDRGDFGDGLGLGLFQALNADAPPSISYNVLVAAASGTLTVIDSTDTATAASTVIEGTSGTDLIIVSSSNQSVNGRGGNDQIIVGSGLGVTTILNSGDEKTGILVLHGIDPGDVVISANRLGQLILTTDSEGSQVVLEGAADGSLGAEKILFDDGTVWTASELIPASATGTSGDDALYGTTASEVFDGHGGNDFAAGHGGGATGDKFIFNRGYGTLEISEFEYGGNNTLAFGVGISSDDVAVTSDGSNFILTVGDGGDRIILDGMFANAAYGVQHVTFADGTGWSKQDILNAEIAGGSVADDFIQGTSASEVLDGHGGNDVVIGGGGADAFIFNLGYGHLEINELSDGSTLLLGAGITPGSVKISYVFETDGSCLDIKLQIGVGGDEVILKDMLLGTQHGVQSVTFTDGTIWSWQDIMQQLISGTVGDDHLFGSAADDVFDGRGGNDTFFGLGGNDTIKFGIGSGRDTFYQRPQGLYTAVNNITVEVGDGITSADMEWKFSGEYISDNFDIIGVISGTDDVITIRNGIDNGGVTFKFSDGTILSTADFLRMDFIRGAGSDFIYGNYAQNVISGGPGDDEVEQYFPTSNTYLFNVGDGRDVINDTGENIVFGTGILSTDITVEAFGANGATPEFYLIKTGHAGDQLLIRDEVEALHFADGSMLSWTDVLTRATSSSIGDIGASSVDMSSQDSFVNSPFSIALHNVAPADITIEAIHSPSGLRDALVIYGLGHTVVDAQSYYNPPQIYFDDGTEWTAAYVQTLLDQAYGGVPLNVPPTYSINDGMVEYDGSLSISDPRTLTFTDVSSDQVRFSRAAKGSDGSQSLIIDIWNGEKVGRVEIRNELLSFGGEAFYYPTQAFEFADGTTLTLDQVKQGILDSEETSGDDYIQGFYGNDLVEAGRGADVLKGLQGSDTYIWSPGDGNDTIADGGLGDGREVNSLVLHSVVQSDVSVASDPSGDATWILTIGREVITVDDDIEFVKFDNGSFWDIADLGLLSSGGFGMTTTEMGTAGSDTLGGTAGNDVVDGGAGNDSFTSSLGNDLFIYGVGSGNDAINESGAPDHKFGTDAIKLVELNALDVAFARAGNGFSITIKSSGETLTVSSFKGLERIFFADGTVWKSGDILANSWFRGSAGNDSLIGGSGDDTFVGGAGDDSILGGAGSDTFVWSPGDGNDNIEDDGVQGSSDIDTLVLHGVAASDVVLKQGKSNDLGVLIRSTGEMINIVQEVAAPVDGIDRITFDDGTVWDLAYINSHAAFLGTAGNDFLDGTLGNDIFIGDLGDDDLHGDAGSDTYIYRDGDGSDTIDEESGSVSDTDNLVLSNLNLSDVALSRDGSDLKIAMGDGSVVTVAGQFLRELGTSSEVADSDGVEEISFSDGSSISREQISLQIFGATLAIYGSVAADAVTGTSANELIYGGEGDDSISGGSGNDVLSGGQGNDSLSGGVGDDFLIGGSGSDTYYYGAGDGADTIEDSAQLGEINTLVFGSGIAPADVQVGYKESGDVVLSIGTGSDRITFTGEVDVVSDEIVFSDGTTWTSDDLLGRISLGESLNGSVAAESFYGSDGSDVIDGDGGSDYVEGHGGGDTFVYNPGYGTLTISENTSGSDTNTLQFGVGISADDVTVSAGDNGSIVFTVGASGDQVIVLANTHVTSGIGINQVKFADGTIWTSGDIYSTLPETSINGTSGNDILVGTGGANVLNGLGGDDLALGQGGDDTYVFNVGYGQLWISDGDGDNDVNTLLFGAGIAPGDVTRSVNATGDVILTIGTSGDQVTLSRQNWLDGEGIQQVKFDNGTIWAVADIYVSNLANASSGDDVLFDTEGSDNIDALGASSKDAVVGHGGGDIFIFRQGYGVLELNEIESGSSTNVLLFGSGINPNDVIASDDGLGNLVLTIGSSGDAVVLDGMVYDPADGVQQIQFADGTVWLQSGIIAGLPALPVAGTTGDDFLVGSHAAEIFDGLGGNDIEWGFGGNDTFVFNSGYGHLEIQQYNSLNSGIINTLQFGAGIAPEDITKSLDANGNIVLTVVAGGDQVTLDYQNYKDGDGVQRVTFANGTIWTAQDLYVSSILVSTGDDTVFATAGAETIDALGAVSLDYVQGEGGGDTFVFKPGYGELNISETDISSSTINTLAFGAGITPNDVAVVRDDWGDIVLDVGSGNDVVYLYNMLNDPLSGVQRITFADGTIWNGSSLVEGAILGTSGADGLIGTAGPNIFDGLGGSDVETGSGGGDTFKFYTGYGELEVNEIDSATSPANVLKLGQGIAPEDVLVSSDGSGDIVLIVGGNGDQVKLDGMLGDAHQGVQSVVFADGTVWTRADILAANSTILGTSGNDILSGGSGAETFDGVGGTDMVSGGGGGDSFLFGLGYGQLEINEVDANVSAANVLSFGPGIAAANVTVTSNGHGALILTDSVSGDVVMLDGEVYDGKHGVQSVHFSDGTAWSRQNMLDMGIVGTSADNALTGTSGADIIAAKGGNDLVTGNGGNDTIFFNANDGTLEINEYDEGVSANNVLVMGAGINASDLSVRDDGYGDFVIYNNITEDTVLLDSEVYSGQWGVQEIRFADGQSWSREDLVHSGVVGTIGDDTLDGTSGNDIFDGLGGSDVVGGWLGGSDTFYDNVGYGNLEVTQWNDDAAARNTLVMGPGIDPGDIEVRADGYGDFVLYNMITEDNTFLDAEISSSRAGVQKIVFSDSGTVWTRQDLLDKGIVGTSGNNTLTGTSAAEFFQGKGGVDTINGGGGNDIYVFKPGDGQVTINNVGGSGAHGSLEFSRALDDEDLWFKHTGNDLIIQRIGSTDKVTVAGWFGSNSSAKLSEITLDGNIEVDSQLNSLISAMATYSTAHGSFNPATATAMPADTTLQNAIAASWHG